MLAGSFVPAGLITKFLLCLRVSLQGFIVPARSIASFYSGCGLDYKILLCLQV